MAKIIHPCPVCSKPTEFASEAEIFPGTILRQYKCGHSELVDALLATEKDSLDIVSLDGKRLFPFQLEGARFLEKANGRALIADEMGLGKTIQFIAWVVAHPEVRPFACFVKSSLRAQWTKECIRWGDLSVQLIDSTACFFLKGMDGYIISVDSAWRIGTKLVPAKFNPRKKVREPIPGETLPEKLQQLGVKTICIDECQTVKNTDTNRTRAVQDCARQMTYAIGLSGTPILNHAGEFAPILNIIVPDKVPVRDRWIDQWCSVYFDGYSTRIGGVKDPKRFKEWSKDFIIRRERKDVLPDLPRIFRQFTYHDLGEAVEAEYEKTVKEFQDYYSNGDRGSLQFESNVIAFLSRMRHLTGQAKVDPVCEFVENFILETDRKLTIFVHHKDVGEMLKLKLEKMGQEWKAEFGKGVLQFKAGMEPRQVDELLEKFKGPNYRIMIASTLAAGEGLNLQFCSDCILMERQWNPGKEEQAESRFPRPGSTADKINATYPTAVGTVDEFFAELVEKKRQNVASIHGENGQKWDESSLIKELAQIIAEKGGRKWGW